MGYRRGNLLGIKLVNFQKYSSAAFTFDPWLNLIVGPNGSGKSTVTNALAMVFGGTGKTLNRALPPQGYIKHGEEAAEIEVEICASENSVLRIKRAIGASGRESKWAVNGSDSTCAKVKALIGELGIDVDNMCQFLPQDKVSDFAKLTEEEQLDETLSSRKDLGSRKRELVDRQDAQRRREKEAKELGKALEEGEKKLCGMEKDVEGYREAKKRESKISIMEAKIKWIRYNEAKKRYESMRSRIKAMEKSRDAEKAHAGKKSGTIGKLKKELAEKEGAISYAGLKESNRVLAERIREMKTAQSNVREQQSIAGFLEDALKEKRNEASGESERTREMQEKLKSEERVSHPGDFPEAMEKDLLALEERRREQGKKQFALEMESSEISRRINALERSIKQMEDSETSKLEGLGAYHKDTYEAVKMLERLQGNFTDEVILPLFLTLSIKEEQFVDEVSAFLGFHALTSFICKNNEDFNTFVRIFKDENKLAVNVIEDCSGFDRKPQVDRDRIVAYGFAGYLIDFVECREEVKNFLCVFSNFHNIPASARELDEIEMFGAFPSIRRAAINKKYVEIKRSRYTEDFTIVCSGIKRGKEWSALDREALDGFRGDLEQCKRRRAGNEALYKTSLLEVDKLRKSLEALEGKKSEHDALVDRHKLSRARANKLHALIADKVARIGSLEKETQSLLQRKLANEGSLENAKRALEGEWKVFLASIKSSSAFNKLLLEKWKERGALASLGDKIAEISEEVAGHLQKSAAIKLEIEGMRREERELYDASKALMQHAQSGIRVTEEVRGIFEELPEGIEGLEELVCKEKTRLSFMVVDRQVADDYEQLKGQTESTREMAEQKRLRIAKEAERISAEAEALRKALDAFVEGIDREFGRLFEAIGSRGAVAVDHRGDSARSWKLHISVQFRKGRGLEVLSSGRQSGGEKSVSTILYLLAMQASTQAPFRLVDEINQGMDRRNERLVHNLLVSLCRDKACTQLFVITPKLVPGLDFSSNMKVHSIFFGPLATK